MCRETTHAIQKWSYSTKSLKSVKRLLKFHVKSAHLVDQVTKMPKDGVKTASLVCPNILPGEFPLCHSTLLSLHFPVCSLLLYQLKPTKSLYLFASHTPTHLIKSTVLMSDTGPPNPAFLNKRNQCLSRLIHSFKFRFLFIENYRFFSTSDTKLLDANPESPWTPVSHYLTDQKPFTRSR